jgi:hypothetical protein
MVLVTVPVTSPVLSTTARRSGSPHVTFRAKRLLFSRSDLGDRDRPRSSAGSPGHHCRPTSPQHRDHYEPESTPTGYARTWTPPYRDHYEPERTPTGYARTWTPPWCCSQVHGVAALRTGHVTGAVTSTTVYQPCYRDGVTVGHGVTRTGDRGYRRRSY